ncbi:peptidase inhibitor family I36 protein [Streptomyces globisporus]|uniref:peptidase inhibitor family I36 protein n=1 Tax=Streptomyces globisporus TaxID=1908 RepID=UPI00378C11E8
MIIKSVALAATAAALLMPSPTQAADASPVTVIKGQGKEACPKESVCLYEDTDYNAGRPDARIWALEGPVSNLGDYQADDQASSVFITLTGSYDIGLYQARGFDGPYMEFQHASLPSTADGLTDTLEGIGNTDPSERSAPSNNTPAPDEASDDPDREARNLSRTQEVYRKNGRGVYRASTGTFNNTASSVEWRK